jgi:hypothetical protein
MSEWIMFDPPSGWMYGFPKRIRAIDLQNLKDILKDAGYPEKDIPLALEYSRYWDILDG